MKNNLLIFTTCFQLASQIFAQNFTPEVKEFITIDTTKVAITNVTIIDGLGKNIRNMEVVFKDEIGFDSKKIFESVEGKVGLN